MAFKAKKKHKKLVVKAAPVETEPDIDLTDESEAEPEEDAVADTTLPSSTEEELPAPVAVAKATSGAKSSMHRGKKTGMPVMKYQDWQMSVNNERKFSDEALLDEMLAEFPNAKGKIFTANLETRLSILQAVRRLFNAGRHGKQTIAPPTGGSLRYNSKGEVINGHGKAVSKAKAA